MRKKFYKKKRLSYYTKGGFWSILIAIGSLLFFAGALVWSVYCGGAGGLLVGKLAFVSFLLSLAGFALGLFSYTEKDQYYTLSAIGAVSNGLILVLYLCGYLIFL